MKARKITRSCISVVLAIVMMLSCAVVQNTGEALAAGAAVKKVILKIGKKKVNKKTVSLAVGKSTKLKVAVTPKKAKKKVSFSSSNKSAVTVSKKGKATAVAAGSAVITAKVTGKNKKSKKAWVKINVKGSGNNTEIKVPGTSIAPVVLPSASAKTQTSSAPGSTSSSVQPISTNSSEAQATEKTESKATLAPEPQGTKKAETQTTTAPGSTAAQEVLASSVTVSLASQTIAVGSQTVATANVLPANASQVVTWSSSDDSVATVNATGVVVGMKDGVAMITAKSANGISGSAIITVKSVSVTGVSFSKDSMDLTVGTTTTLAYSIAPADATNMRVEWTSDNTEVATVVDGKVTAIKAGVANITVKTVDGGFLAVMKITVKDDTKQDVDGIKAELSNHLEGYPNTVLVGNNARVNFTVTKNGVGVSDQVEVAVKDKRGYADYYTINNDSISTNENGQGFVTVKLKNDKNFDPIISEIDSENAAFAGMTLELTAGGANVKTSIDVTFGQILTQTMSSLSRKKDNKENEEDEKGSAISVENQYDVLLNQIEPNNNKATKKIGESDSKEKYKQEYVPDQQVSSEALENGDHKVVLDAAPLLIIPPVSGTKEKAGYTTVVDFEKSEYSVYEDETTNVKVIEGVPGGLEYLTLTGEYMQLSDYSRVVVRAYYQGTRIPISLNGKTLEEIFEPSTIIDENTTGKKLQIGHNIFGDTLDTGKIDLWIFVESAGQVCEDDNRGIKITSAEGTYKNQNMKNYELVRVPEIVDWKKVSDAYTAESKLDDAESYLGEEYDSGKTYMYAMPAFPRTGDAIIKAISKTGAQETQYYLYPTETVNNTTKLCEPNSELLIKSSDESVKELANPTWKLDDRGRLVIDSEKAGYVCVCATVNYGENESYDVYSAVYYLPIPEEAFDKPSDFYAITGENVTLTATLVDRNGNKANGVDVKWKNYEKDGIEVVNDPKVYSVTNSQGEVKLVLKGNRKISLKDIYVVGVDQYGNTSDRYTVKSVLVDDQKAFTKHASIHWVKPGLFYKTRVDYKADTTGDFEKGYSVNTVDNDEIVNVTGENASNYLVGKTWIVGANVVGETEDDSVEIIDIDNLKVSMDSSTPDDKVSVIKKDKENGVCTVTSDTKGKSILTMNITGYEDYTKRCKIVVRTLQKDQNGDEYWVDTVHTSVGTVDEEEAETITNYFGKGIKLDINWQPDGIKLSMVNNNVGYDIGNKENGVKINPVVYAKLVDKKGNGIEGQKIEYNISVNKDGQVKENLYDEPQEENTDKNGLVEIEVPLPDEACTYTITAKLTAETTASTSIAFTDKKKVFELVSTPKINIDNNTIKLRFNAPVNNKIGEYLKDFISVDKNGDTIDVESAEIDSSDSQLVIVRTNEKQTLSSDVTVSIDNKYKDDQNIIHYFLSDEGILLRKVSDRETEKE